MSLILPKHLYGVTPIPPSPSPVSPLSPVPATPSKQRTRPKLPFPPDFSGEQSSGRAFLNSCTLYLRLAPEQFTCNEEKSSGPSPSSRMDVLQSGLKTSFARRQTLAFFQFDPGPTLNNSSGVNSFRSTQKRTPSTLWRGLRTIKETGRWTITWTAS